VRNKYWIIDIALIILIIAMGVFIYIRLDSLLDPPEPDDPPQVLETAVLTEFPTPTPTLVFNYSGDQEEPASDFTLTSLEGEEVSLSDFLGMPVMINFWATWCPPCKEEMPIIQRFLEEYQGDFIVLAVNVGEKEDIVREFAEENDFDFVFLPDPANATAFTYGVYAYPTSVFIDEEGMLQSVYIGELNDELLSAYLQEMGVEL
jgi:thiol-disulfide isomerase/thioredoxin